MPTFPWATVPWLSGPLGVGSPPPSLAAADGSVSWELGSGGAGLCSVPAPPVTAQPSGCHQHAPVQDPLVGKQDL